MVDISDPGRADSRAMVRGEVDQGEPMIDHWRSYKKYRVGLNNNAPADILKKHGFVWQLTCAVRPDPPSVIAEQWARRNMWAVWVVYRPKKDGDKYLVEIWAK